MGRGTGWQDAEGLDRPQGFRPPRCGTAEAASRSMMAGVGAISEDGPPFLHEALLYSGEDDFLARTSDFIREGLADGEPVLVAVGTRKIDRLSSLLGEDASQVRFVDIRDVGSNPARII